MAQAGRRKAAAETRLILDSGAIIALAKGNESTRSFLRKARDEAMLVVVPPGAIAETVRENGPRNALVNLVLKRIDAIPPVTERVARLAGILLGRANSDATIDALLVAEAANGNRAALILTSDPRDIAALATAYPTIRIATV